MKIEDLRIGLDLDDCIVDWWRSYELRFDVNNKPRNLLNHIIYKNVYKIKDDRDWWINLPKLRDIDFIPELYCTKRISPKSFSIEWLRRNGFPIRPVYQLISQSGNKANLIKGRVDIFIDDSIENFEKCNKAGVFTLLLTTPRNKYYQTDLRIDELNYWDIINKYGENIR